jgi:tRNA A37 threonylcarbamoyladenosine modification protein TsaB
MYSLFIDTLSSPAFVCLFDTQRNIVDSISWEGRHAEFDTLIESIDILLKNNHLDYQSIEGLACVIWPGGFTGIRVTTLVANTLNYSFWIRLYPITVSDFFQYQKCSTPWILPLTKTEVLLWESYDMQPIIIKITTLNRANKYISNQILPFENSVEHSQANNYQLFFKNFPFSQKVSLLQPLYARDPNILLKK